MKDLDGGDIRVLRLADQEHHAGHIRREMELLRADIDVPGQDIVGDDVFDKSRFVVLLLIAGLRFAHGNRGENADAPGDAVMSADKYGILELAVQPAEQTERPVRRRKDLIREIASNAADLVQIGADQAQLAARNHKALVINDADGPVGRILQLNDNTLKDSAGHGSILLHHFCIIRNGDVENPFCIIYMKAILQHICLFFNRNFLFFLRNDIFYCENIRIEAPFFVIFNS